MSDQPQASEHAPEGYCPKCDYPTGVGTCPECGAQLEARRLRRRPRPWLRKHWLGVAAAVLIPAVGLWIASGRVNLIPLLPTWYLLDWQSDHTPRAVMDELARRVAAGRMSADQEERFFKQWLGVEWSTGSWAMRALSWMSSPTAKPTAPGVGVLVREIRVNSEPLPTTEFGVIDPRKGPASCSDDRIQVVLLPGFSRRPAWGGISFFQALNLAAPPVVACVAYSTRVIEIDSTVAVSKPAGGRLVASWPSTYRLQFVAHEPVRFDALFGSNMGGEDLVYPYGIIPNRPGVMPARKRGALTPAYERVWRKGGEWMPPDRIGVPGKPLPGQGSKPGVEE